MHFLPKTRRMRLTQRYLRGNRKLESSNWNMFPHAKISLVVGQPSLQRRRRTAFMRILAHP
jgi:hypothetical protein